MLNIFNGKSPSPKYRLLSSPGGKLQTITVGEEVESPTGHGTIIWRLMSYIRLCTYVHTSLERF